MKLPKSTDEQKSRRKNELQKALREATEVPTRTLENAYGVRLLAQKIIKIGNKNARSDAETALELSKAAIAGSLSNVRLNLESLKEDVEFSESIAIRVNPILEKLSMIRLDVKSN